MSWPFLIELDLSKRRDISALPPSISQCSLLRRINISWTSISRPPIVLFSIPAFRVDPSGIRYGTDQVCSVELARAIVNESRHYPQFVVKIYSPRGVVRRVSSSADTTTAMLLRLAFPELSQLFPYLFFVRSCESCALRIIPDNVPVCCYAYPHAHWSLELRYIPDFVPRGECHPEKVPLDAIPLFKELIDSRKEAQRDDVRVTELAAQADALMQMEDFNNFQAVLELSSYVQSFHSRIITDIVVQANPGPLTMRATNLWTAVMVGTASYGVFPTDQIALIRQDGKLMLSFGKSAIRLGQQRMPVLDAFLSFLAITTPLALITPRDEPSQFDMLIMRAVPLYLAGRNPKMTQDKTSHKPEELQRLLEELGPANVRGKRIGFVRKQKPRL